jgi:hypothetical protein
VVPSCPVVCQFISYAMSHLYCQCQKHKHFGFSNVRFRKASIIKSVYVIVVVMVNLHHQQSGISTKYRRKMLSGLESSFMYDSSLSFFPLTPPLCVYCYEGKRDVSIAGLLAAESVCLTNSLWHPLCHRHWTKLNCWTHDNWLFGVTTEVMKPLAHFQNLPQLN